MTDPRDNYDIQKRAILVKVSTTMLGIVRKDVEATDTAAHTHNADVNQVRVVKNLLNPKSPVWLKIRKIRGKIRNFHRDNTGPWQDEGFRVITTKRYSNWRETLEALTADFDAAVDDLVTAYDDLKREAQINLGNLYDAALYPEGDKIRQAFSVVMETEVIPSRGSVILDLDKARTDKLVADATAADQRRVKKLAEYTHQIVRKELEGMLVALKEFGDDNPEAKTKRTRTFRDSLVKRMAALADTLPGLNVTGDLRLDKLAQEIAGKLTIVSAAELRGNKTKGDNRTDAMREADAATKRDEVQANTQEILDDLDSLFAAD